MEHSSFDINKTAKYRHFERNNIQIMQNVFSFNQFSNHEINNQIHLCKYVVRDESAKLTSRWYKVCRNTINVLMKGELKRSTTYKLTKQRNAF